MYPLYFRPHITRAVLVKDSIEMTIAVLKVEGCKNPTHLGELVIFIARVISKIVIRCMGTGSDALLSPRHTVIGNRLT